MAVSEENLARLARGYLAMEQLFTLEIKGDFMAV